MLARRSIARKTLLKSGSGTQKDFDAAQSVLRNTEALLNSSQTRLARRGIVKPGHRGRAAGLFSSGRGRFCGSTDRVAVAAGELEGALLRTGDGACEHHLWRRRHRSHCDGCADDFKARVSFISGSAEFTPPVIYSLDERSKLVYLIEALPDDPGKLRVAFSRSMFCSIRVARRS